MSGDSVDSFVDDLEEVARQPKWIKAFRRRYYADAALPFLIVYQASAIAGKPGTPLYKNKSGAIAVATSNLQKAGCLMEGSNTLSERGDIREIAIMSRIGKPKTLGYIKRFENL